MTHGYADQSGKPIKTTLMNGRTIDYSTRNEELQIKYNGVSENYSVEEYEVRIPVKGGPVILDGKVFDEWSDIRGELL